MKLYHGTRAVYVDRIRQEGLHAPSHVNAWTWYMLTTSPEQAAAYSPHDDSVVLEYDIPDDLLDALDGGLLGIPTEHNVYGFSAMAYGIPRGLPGSYLVAVHPAPGGQLSKTAAQAAITAAAQPWTLGPDDLPATFSWGPRTFTLKYDPHKRNHASQLGDDIIVVGPDFFQADTRLRRAILLHEIGHVLSDIGLKDPNGFSWRAVECLPSFGHLNGQTTPGEVTAEAYSVAIDEPEFLRENAPELLALITDAARAHGFPLTASKTATTLYHGTNAVAAEHIGRDGFRAVDTREIVRQIEDLYGLPIDSVWNHEFYRMARGRSGRDQAYFTTNPNVAASYAAEGGEALRQGLQAAWSILHYALPYVGTPEGDACDRWLRDQMDAHFRPAVVTVDLPLTETEERLAAHQIALSLPIPASAVLDVRTSAKTAATVGEIVDRNGDHFEVHEVEPGIFEARLPGAMRWRLPNGEWVQAVAYFQVFPSGEVEWVHVETLYQRQGIAQALWNFVKSRRPDLHHSTEQTDEGAAWAKAVGASKTAGQQLYFHIGRPGLGVGTELIPGGPGGRSRMHQGPVRDEELLDWVWLSQDAETAVSYALYAQTHFSTDVAFYLARPNDRVEDRIGFHSGSDLPQKITKSAIVVAQFPLIYERFRTFDWTSWWLDAHPEARGIPNSYQIQYQVLEQWRSSTSQGTPLEIPGIGVVAAWADVRAKAARIRRDGGVRVIASTGDTITAQVQGDNHVYQTSLLREPGTKSVAMWECFLPDAPVLMADGTERPISAVVPGDEVITHEGRIARVMRAEPKPYNGDIVTVRFRGDYRPLIATAGHEVYAANRDYALQGAGRDALYKTTGSTVPVLTPRDGWIPIEQLAASDYLSRSIVGLEEPLVVTCPAPLGNRAHGYTHDDLDVKVDTDLAYWLGWYMAEGSLVGRGHRVVFSLALDEGWVCERLDAIAQHHFGVVGTRRVRESTIDYRVSHFALAHLARTLIGTGSTTKRLAPAMLTLPLPEQESFMDAWVAGDGHAEPRGVTTLHAANETSLRQAREILGRLGVVANLRMAATNPGGLASTQNAGPIWRLQWAGGQRTISQFRQDGMIWHKITSVERGPYVGEVWDIEVEEDHSFRAYGMNVHNCSCPWAAYSWGRSGRWRKYEGRMCAHAMALVYEAQAQEWGGNNVTEGEGFAEEPFFYEAPPIKDDWRIDAPKPTGGDDLAKAAALLPQGLYHGTVHDLPIGTELRPGVVSGNYDNQGKRAAQVVWMTDDPEDALNWARLAAQEQGLDASAARVYLVEPIGPVSTDMGTPAHLERQGITHSTADAARVVGAVEDYRSGHGTIRTALSNEDLVSVAEEVMERSGLAGDDIIMPVGHVDDPEFQAASRPLIEWASRIAGHYVNVYFSAYQLAQEGNPQGFVTGTGSIVVRQHTNQMTILHELAHVITGSEEGRHSPEFIKTLHRLYDTHLGETAGQCFWGIVGSAIDKTASTPTIYRGLRVEFPSSVYAQIEALLSPPLEESQIDQERKVARVVVDHLQAAHWGGLGLGRHWSTRKEMAETAALAGAANGVAVVLTATYDPSGVDAEYTQAHPEFRDAESEITLRPGAPVTITNVELPYWSGAKGLDLIDGPIRATASIPSWDLSQLDLPTHAHDGDCLVYSPIIAQHLQDQGVTAVVVTVLGFTTFMGQEVLGFAHQAVLAGDYVIDATATQFSPQLDSLLVLPVERYIEVMSQATGTTVRIDGPGRIAAKDSDFLRTLSITESGDSADQTRKLQVVDPSGAEVAYIAVYGRYYKKAKGEVADIYVSPAFRRRGVATWLFAQAQGWWKDLDVKHSKDLTDDGRAWKKTLGALDEDRFGQCYNLSLRYVKDHPDWGLVHGSIGGPRAQLNRPDNPSPRIGHAWAIRGDQVWEPISGQTFTKSDFRRLFDGVDWITYTAAEAQALSAGSGHWGPWDPEYSATDELWRAEFRVWQDRQRTATKNPRFEGVALKQDDDGKWYVTTHRARSDSYDSPEDIPQSDVDFIESTGSLHMAETHTAAWGDPLYYHGTNASLAEGAELTGGMEARHSPGADNTKVWVSDRIKEAADYGVNVYLVEPVSTPKKRGKAHEFFTDGAVVVRQLSADEVIRALHGGQRTAKRNNAFGMVIDEATGLPYINARPVSIYPSWDPFAGISDFTGSTHHGSGSWKDEVSNLPETSEWDMAIDDAMVGVTEMGIREEDDSEVFWRAVHDQAVAEMNGKGHLAAQGSTHTAVNFNGIEIPSPLPPAPGTVSCPSGKVRVWHYTGSYESMGAILRTGLSRSNAQGSTYGEPNVIWCSSVGPPDVYGKAFVEFFMDPSEADINADLAQRDPNGARDYTLNVDRIGPDRFVTWSIPTLAYCRDLLGRKQQVAEGMYDTVDDPEAAAAVEWVKKHGALKRTAVATGKKGAIVWRGFNMYPYYDSTGAPYHEYGRGSDTAGMHPELVEFARKIKDGTLTFNELARQLHTDGVGAFWAEAGPHASEGGRTGEQVARSYAGGVRGSYPGAHTDLEEPFSKYWDSLPGNGEMGIVLKAELVADTEWSDGEGMLELDDGHPLRLLEVQYNGGWGWHTVQADGRRITATLQGDAGKKKSLKARIKTAAIEASDPLAGLKDVLDTIDKGEHTHSGVIIKAIDSGRVLMTQRTPYAGDDEGVYGRWEFPGGGIDDGEDAFASALREFGEETGLELPEDWAVEGCYENGKYLGIVILVPHEAWTTNASLLSHEVMGVGWFDPDLIEETELAREEISKTDWELVKEASAPTKLYHAAPKSARDSIAQHGLDWHIGNPGGSAPHGNFFHQSREAIDDMMSDGLSETHDLYEVDVKGLNLSFEVDPYQDDAVYEAEPIPASRVRRVASKEASSEDGREDPVCDLCGEPMEYGTETAEVTNYAMNGRVTMSSVMHYGCADGYVKEYGLETTKVVWPNGDVEGPTGIGKQAAAGITYQVDIEKTPDSLMPGVPDRATVHAFRGGHEVGTMQLNADFDAANNKSYRRWKIWNVWVDEDARRQGIAEGLVKALHDETPDMWVYHGGFMSAEGEAFGRKLVEKYPRWNKLASNSHTAEADGVEATLHEEPEAALPMTDGSREEVDDLFSPEAIAQRAAALGEDNSDIAAAADAYLAKTAVKVFSPKEQMDLIEEGAVEGVTASNLDRLDIEGTHYQALEERYRHLDASAQDLFL